MRPASNAVAASGLTLPAAGLQSLRQAVLPGKPGLRRAYPVDASARFGGYSQVFWRPVRSSDNGVRKPNNVGEDGNSRDIVPILAKPDWEAWFVVVLLTSPASHWVWHGM